MLQRFFVILLIVAGFSAISFAQQNSMDNNYNGQWNKVDSLINKGLPKSAIALVQDIRKDAIAKGDRPNAIKANLFLITSNAEHEENSTVDGIKKAESFIAASEGAEKAIWQSVTAQLYWDYFQRNSWKFYSRTTMENTTSTDIDTWDIPAFMKKIASLYEASVADREKLKAIPVSNYTPILTEGVNTRLLRPTLYDLLVFRAISFFQNDEKDVTQPANQFQMNGAMWFDDAADFSQLKVKVANPESLHFQALKLYQEVIAFHLNDHKPDALIDADLHRLMFVRSNSSHPGKDSLYLNALLHIENKYANIPAVAQVSYLIAEALQGEGELRPFRGVNKLGVKVKKRDLPAIRTRLQSIVSKYPGSEGAINASNLLRTLEAAILDVKVEEVNVPGENIKALISYKNTNSVKLKLYRTSSEVIGRSRNSSEELLKEINKLNVLRSWTQPLPGASDMELHSTEVKVDPLSSGTYFIVAATNTSLKGDDSIFIAAQFQVSSLSFILGIEGRKNGYILNRKTGQPVPGVKAEFWSQKYNNKTYRYDAKSIGSVTGNADGVLVIPAADGSDYEKRLSAITLISGNDTLQVSGYFDNYRGGEEPEDVKEEHTFFFTDRAIYRPGQTIYFKGIMLESSDGNRKNNVIANRKTTITFYDVNGQKVASLDKVTNEYGSVSGQFTAPEGLLGGRMRIANDNGSAYFFVEEYKRPKFYVDFDTLKGSYALNAEVKVKGFAKAYAGNNIDGAAVKYRVVRRARFPYYWCYYRWGMPSSPEMEITEGAATTKEDGSFEISFTTIPDESIDPRSLPVFTYTVYADVTDLNGESRSSNVGVNAGYRSMQIKADVDEDSRPKDLNEIKIRTENLNGVFIPATLKVSIARLEFPGFLRKRLWETPDQFVMTEAEFRNAFPGDEYKEEANYMNWAKGKTLFEQTLNTTADGKLNIPENTWYQNGWYVIEINGKDAQGNDVTEKKYTYVWAPGKKEDNQKDIIAYTEKDAYEPGDNLELWLATGVDNPYLLTYATNNYPNTNPLKIKVEEKDRGGLAFAWLYVSNNRVYTVNKVVNIPWTNKDLQLEWGTHRDKLQPGAAEEWTLTIKGNKKEKVAAELLAGMYDASLDAFRPHAWERNRMVPFVYARNAWNSNFGFGMINAQLLKYPQHNEYNSVYDKRYDEIIYLGSDYGYEGGGPRMMYANAPVFEDAPRAEVAASRAKSPSAKLQNKAVGLVPGIVSDSIAAEEKEDSDESEQQNAAPSEMADVQVRKNLQETAFFFPQMATDAEGNVSFKFTMPEALTEWKMMAFAHTKDWKTGYLEGKVKTQKDLMVVPNLPRFLRQKDDIVISSKITNLSDADLTGQARIELIDAVTLQPINLSSFQKLGNSPLSDVVQNFKAAKGQSTSVNWSLHIPESRYSPVIIRIVAKAGNFSDGEENTLPVITNRTLVTETLPMPVRGNEEKTFTLDKLVHQQSNTLTTRSLTVEFTGNPAWYAVQALPYLMEYPYECAEQTFNRFYANALAGHIVAQSPKVEKIFEQWKTQDTAALMSNLQKNEELKSALLEETPWVMEAQNESEQKRRIASLFETHQLAKGLRKNLKALEDMQLEEGGFPWFKGMQSDRYITQYIVTGIARLQHLNVKSADDNNANKILARALPYLDRMLQQDYDYLVKSKINLDLQHISYSQVQYLYMRSFYKDQSVPVATQKAFDYYKKQAVKYWTSFNPYMEGQIALALHRMGDAKTAQQIIASLREKSTTKEEMGMYWKDMPDGYWWYEAPVEAQSLLVETFSEVAKDDKAVDAMKVWLLKQKQTQNWKTTKATADACYALLLNGSDWLSSEPVVTISLGNETIKSTEIKTEAGTGYFKKTFEGSKVKNDMGNIKVSVETPGNKNEGVSWGAVYWQYFEDLDKITGSATPLSLKKQLFIERNSSRGPVLTEIKEGNELAIGDKVKVRVELRVDRDMEYVHMKDMRAACFEPLNVLSGYRYQGGLGYYESTKDVSTNFFFNYLRKGTYVFEYPVVVTAKGNFSNGISTIQCMYAPEFSSHSEGIRVEVK